MDAPLRELCRRVPSVIGAVLCDDEGETVVSVLGGALPPPAAEARALDHVPRSMALHMPVGEFLIRLVGAESCAALRAVERAIRAGAAGALSGVHVGYGEVDVLLRPLPEDYYLLVALRRPSLVGAARRWVEAAARDLAEAIRE